MTDPIFCQTVGLEIEVTNVDVHNIYLPSSWRITGDASVEQDVITINGIPTVNNTESESLLLSRQVHGGEILSSIIDTQRNYLVDLKNLCSTLIQRGEPYQSERAGLHVHLSFTSPPLEILKAIIKLGCYLEDVFFLVGGMGYEFRGQTNDCSYCRPITTPGPQVILDKMDNLYPCMVVDDLMTAKSVNNFWTRLGDYNDLGGSRYIPIRYHWLNLWNLKQQKQTLEFRVFNRSLKPRYIEAAIELCQAFGKAVMYYAFNPDELDELECNSVYDYREKDDIFNTLVSFTSSRLESRTIDTLLRIMDATPIESIRFPKQAYWFHLRFHRGGSRSPTHWVRSSYRPSISYKESEVAIPTFLDIHNLRSINNSNASQPVLGLDSIEPIVEEVEVRPSNSLRESVRSFSESLNVLSTNYEQFIEEDE